MKARNFRYVRPATLNDACRILADADGEAVPIAGGQSLLAGLNMRLSAPKLLVDIAELKELRGQSHADGVVRLGALTRHADLLSSDLVRAHLPLLIKAAPHIGHVAIRNRGTLGGSLAYADPAAELPACAVALGATLMISGPAGERKVKAEEFFKGLFETDLRAGELITAVEFPSVRAGVVTGFAELSRRRGDFALAGLAAVVTIKNGTLGDARLVYIGCGDRAKVAKAVSKAVAGQHVPLDDTKTIDEAVHQDLAPEDTPGLRADTRIQLAVVLTRRVLNDMSQRAAA
jgi:aerobic carbon-monoxide dehydrogenase medium subunit